MLEMERDRLNVMQRRMQSKALLEEPTVRLPALGTHGEKINTNTYHLVAFAQ